MWVSHWSSSNGVAHIIKITLVITDEGSYYWDGWLFTGITSWYATSYHAFSAFYSIKVICNARNVVYKLESEAGCWDDNTVHAIYTVVHEKRDMFFFQ